MPDLDLLWTDDSNVAANGNVVSGWINVKGAEEVRISRNSSGGAYAFEIDWSRDGVTVDYVDPVTVPDDDSVTVQTAGLFARFRVRNTDAVLSFNAHRTNVYAWG